ncbi:SIS domain-containing protein [Salegentibacter salegens]|uniref:Tagatose-6-phosphate ketose/aldose isomerase n=1 Tax=Salegentibacter salegens TaxID=143223 RepID=A0A1M7NNQ4_9FLAO|nr:SIS domain-containing protein [Salegentibacter salegens]PRX40005.1 tagatose-6-phosphate ketose/aldose isomerase [Salegentibacter salegens]SHN05175.1 tagatose-6-phosphate ketose/aldose isomerase [Salegentibacter salegens]
MKENKSGEQSVSHTKQEIEGQPELWESVYDLIQIQEEQITTFLDPILNKKDLEIILTGAGSSAFVGEAAQGLVQKNSQRTTRAIATTDLVTHPELFFPKDRHPVLLISFARSGNSPESVETVSLADSFCSQIYHLVITCNKDGELYKYTRANTKTALAILLPEKANDKSLAMTGSFTSMLLTILLVSDLKDIESNKLELQRIVKQGNLLLENAKAFKEISAKYFERVVFLGSGPMLGIARECHLKLQELTDGQIICKHDSFLGFRHGPRAVTNEKTLLVYLFSPSDHVYKYELDLATSISKDPRTIECVSIGRSKEKALNSCLNIDLNLSPNQELNIVPATLIGQILGYYKSLQLGLNPDNPSISGAISRVVQGVEIYKYPKKATP